MSKTPLSSITGDFPLDEAVLAELPEGCEVISCESHGSSAWTTTARITATLADGTEKRYFLKCATEHGGRLMMEGEFNSMRELYKVTPTFVPKPITWGTFKTGLPVTHFFLCDFIDMSNKLADPVAFGSQLAELHMKSVSPTGQFGFHITTCHGRYPQVVDWDPSWTSFYAKFLKGTMDVARPLQTPWPEFERVSDRIISHVIPALLGPLESEGRSVKPSLIHSDCWEGNIGTDYESGQIYLFDSGALYAHNELEVSMWRCKRSRMKGRAYLREYLRHTGVSEPVEQFDDRNRLYNLNMNLIHSAHYPDSVPRNEAYDDMIYLVEKYAPFEKDGAVVDPNSGSVTSTIEIAA